MKKRILGALAAIAAGFFTLTGCQDEKPYSAYQIGVRFPSINMNLSQDKIDSLPALQKDQYAVANYISGWLINNDFIRTGTLGNPILIEGADEAENDRRAIQLYDNKLSELQKKNLNEIIQEAQSKTGTDGKPELSITTSGSVIFSYILIKGASSQSTKRSQSFTVEYGLPAEPNQQ